SATTGMPRRAGVPSSSIASRTTRSSTTRSRRTTSRLASRPRNRARSTRIARTARRAARRAARYPGRMHVRRLDHFGVDVADLARAERFYTEVLGMAVDMRLPDQILLRHGDGACAL